MEYLTVTEAAEALQLSVPTIKRYIYDGKLNSAKLPGGQHRIAQSEIDRLLTPEGESELSEAPPAEADRSDAERIAVMERWLSELQQEIERIDATLQVLNSYCERLSEFHPHPEVEKMEDDAPQLFVLGTGCQKCDRLYELTGKILAEMDREDISVEHVKDANDIAAYGPVLTPALVLDDTVLLSGRVPTEVALRDLLQRHLQ